jgi:hypothetical protein
VQNTVVVIQFPHRDSAYVFHQFPVRENGSLPLTSVEQTQVTPGNRVAGLLEQLDKMSSDVSSVTRYKDSNFLDLQ